MCLVTADLKCQTNIWLNASFPLYPQLNRREEKGREVRTQKEKRGEEKGVESNRFE